MSCRSAEPARSIGAENALGMNAGLRRSALQAPRLSGWAEPSTAAAGNSLGVERGLELPIVGGLYFRTQQAKPGLRQLVEQLLGIGRVLPGLEGLHMPHLPIGSRFDHVGARFEQPQPQQAVMVRRLLALRNAQPLVIGIELGCHGFASLNGYPRMRGRHGPLFVPATISTSAAMHLNTAACRSSKSGILLLTSGRNLHAVRVPT